MMAHQRELDRRQFESLCGMQCSVEELCGWFGCDETALNTWCVDTYGEDFRSAFDRLAMMGRIALRRDQVAAAKKNVSMARHLEAQRAGHDSPPQKRKNYRLTDAYKEIRQSMLQNLIDNAIRYSGSDRIEVSSKASEGRVEVCVSDFGVGIPPEHLPHVFERFYRVNKSRSRALGGTGLGLAIVKHVVQLHGGTVSVRSVPGVRTDFILRLDQAVRSIRPH